MNYLENLEITEESAICKITALIDSDKRAVLKSDIDLKTKTDFREDTLKNIFSRKNIIFYGRTQLEAPVEIKKAQGELNISLIDTDEIEKQLNKIKDQEKRSKIKWIHISTVQILVKSTYMKDINSPISLAVCDKRILDPQDQIIGIIHGNLANINVKFSTHIGFAMPLTTANLGRSLSLAYKFHRQELMEQNDEPFSITYAINYALTNSHHSITFKDRERIYIDELFQKIVTKEIPSFKPIEKPKTLFIKEVEETPRNSFVQIRDARVQELGENSRNSFRMKGPIILSGKDNKNEENSEVKDLTLEVKKLTEIIQKRL